MALRMSGLASGMDTEAIIKELMTAKAAKKTKIEQSKTKLEWKKEAWADLNTKLMNLFSRQVSKMRLQSTYYAKKATSSNEALAVATASTAAANGSYKMEIKQVASAQYLTSGKVGKDVNGRKVTGTTRLADMDPDLLNKEITIKNGDKTAVFQVRSNSTVNDYVDALKSAGLSASFDEGQERFFISGKNSGTANAFSITTSELSASEVAARQALDQAVDFTRLNAAGKETVNEAFRTLSSLNGTPEENQTKIDAVIESLTNVGHAKQKEDITAAASNVLRAQLYNENYGEVYAEKQKDFYNTDEDGNITDIKEDLVKKYGDQYDTLIPEEQAQFASKEDYIQQSVDKEITKAAKEATTNKVNSMVADKSNAEVQQRLDALVLDGVSDISGFTAEEIQTYHIAEFEGTSIRSRAALEAAVTGLVNDYVNVADRVSTTDGTALNALGLTDIFADEDGAHAVGGAPAGMALTSATDSVIMLNGAELSSASSTLTVNGLSIDLKGVTEAGQSITFTVSNDVSGVVTAVKDFIKEYNAIVKEMTTLFKAPSAKGYEPLTEEDKEGMSEDQIEKWEKKIKDASLRGDSQLGDLMTSMRQALQTSVEISGKRYSLSSFGVVTSPILSENGLLHLYGDPDDPSYSEDTDLLTQFLEQDPEMVAQAFSQITANLYKTMQNKMATSKVSSAFTFYNDKKMDKDIEDYGEQIKLWTTRLEDQEDMFYKQFTAMEKSMSMLQSQMNSLAGLFGTN
ncbi:MAG: flagellar filament capping protein FliD [Lachnoclostridium sp.]|jgi:flagellar hook-associated protein 2|nr:flagellar filament capping protein FliD [Lachnoclostridium sp.]